MRSRALCSIQWVNYGTTEMAGFEPLALAKGLAVNLDLRAIICTQASNVHDMKLDGDVDAPACRARASTA